jgi:prevent-host-death family protein
MERIGVRELRQHASKYLERVEAGETIEIANRGRVIAIISPSHAPDDAREYLIATGQLLRGDGGDVRETKPARARRRAISDALAELREDER